MSAEGMLPRVLGPRRLLVPRRLAGEDIVGDTMVEIGPSDPEWVEWVEAVREDNPAAAAKLAPAARPRAHSTGRK